MPETLPLNTAPTTLDEAKEAFAAFLAEYATGGALLRLEHTTNLTGGRFVLTFVWDDMG